MTGPWTYRGFLTGPAKNSYTIHPGIVDFKGQSYLFYHNATLTLPDGRSGAVGRRSVCVEYLHYNEDGTMQPVTQTVEGVSVPPHPLPHSAPAKIDHGTTDPRVTVIQFAGGYPSTWPGSPALASVADPFQMTPTPLGFNRGRGAATLSQTFVPAQDIPLRRLSLYAGDGFGTDPENPLVLALHDLGVAEAAASRDTYAPGENLLGPDKGLRLAYEPQGAGLLHLDFAKEGRQVVLEAGHRYALELQGRRGSAAFYWRSSRTDVYPGGDAYLDRALAKDRNGLTADFAFALYATAP
jgi:hypothetical protein